MILQLCDNVFEAMIQPQYFRIYRWTGLTFSRTECYMDEHTQSQLQFKVNVNMSPKWSGPKEHCM